MKFAFTLGRMILGGFFLYNGINHFRQHKGLSQYVGSKNVPLPEGAVALSGAALTIGGASLLLGVKPKIGAAALAAFLGSVSPIMHAFWEQDDPQQKQNEMIHFTKNLALLGAMLALTGMKEPWPLSLPIGQPKGLKSWKSKLAA